MADIVDTTNEYTLGLDIGIGSVGAAVLGEARILGLYVRAFDKAETPDGDALGKVRREARLTRRRLHRRAHRLLRLCRLFKREGLISHAAPSAFALPSVSPWNLRAEGLTRQLTSLEWASVLYHLVKHRGFQSNRKAELKADAKLGEMLGGVTHNQQRLDEGKSLGIRTIGELFAKHEDYKKHKRNKAGSYSHTVARAALQDELQQLFTQQASLGNPYTRPEFAAAVEELLLARRPTLSGTKLVEQVGFCPFEPQQRRAPKAMYRAEQFVWLTRLNNLRVQENGAERALTEEERALVLALPFQQNEVSYAQLRRQLGLANTVYFAGLNYPVGANAESKNASKGKAKKAKAVADQPEEAILFAAKAFHALRKACAAHQQEAAWAILATQADTLDAIAYVLTVHKSDSEIEEELRQLGLAPELISALQDVSFDTFIALSQSALKKILPFMAAGERYDQAVQSAGYAHHSQLAHETRQRFLPAFDKALIRNPVVFRALNQARKVVNAIIRHYGAPTAIHIELARDLNKPADERKEITKKQKEHHDNKNKDITAFVALFGREPMPGDLLKWQLYREQDARCPYSQQAIDPHRLFDVGYTEIDHALPFSRSFDDSKNNKVLVLTAENRNKGNRTPFEYLDGAGDSDRWRIFAAWVHANPKYRQAKRQRLLRANFTDTEAAGFLERNLNDTRYICREFKHALETRLQWHPSAGARPQAVVLAGQMTALLRTRWGLLKVRSHGDLHHALDAAVIAAANRRLVKRIADHSRRKELENIRAQYVDPETGEILDRAAFALWEARFPQPWPHFREELLACLSDNPSLALNAVPNYPEEQSASMLPVRVSRAPQRDGLGAAHQETIRSIGKAGKWLAQGKSVIKTPLSSLKLADLAQMVGADDPRQASLIEAIRQRLTAHNGDGSKAFAPSQPPLYKPSQDKETAPIVRSVKLFSTQKSGLLVRQGIANNGDMLRLDIFSKKGKFYMVPIYTADVVNKVLPNKACVANKPETEWLEMDASYAFLFSLHKNDWVRLCFKNKPECAGYYIGANRATAAIDIWCHDRNPSVGKDGKYEGRGIKTAVAIEKYHVDVLGRLFRVQAETREGLSKLQKRMR